MSGIGAAQGVLPDHFLMHERHELAAWADDELRTKQVLWVLPVLLPLVLLVLWYERVRPKACSVHSLLTWSRWCGPTTRFAARPGETRRGLARRAFVGLWTDCCNGCARGKARCRRAGQRLYSGGLAPSAPAVGARSAAV